MTKFKTLGKEALIAYCLMPLISNTYRPPKWFYNGHIATIYSAKLRQIAKLEYKRERLNLSDGDFLDLDFSYTTEASKKLAVVLHGLEGNANRTYMRGCAHYLNEHGWNVVCVNYRGCSGVPNLKYKSYNAGITDDLHEIFRYIEEKHDFTNMALVGYSLGGNLLLKYLGEGRAISQYLTAAVAISAPLDLKGSLARLSERQNWVYRTSFLLSLKSKLKAKWKQFPEMQGSAQISKIKSLLDFDNVYTAPAHGFKDAYEYYAKSSSSNYLEGIEIPTLIINARNDSFLSKNCYPIPLASESEHLFLSIPDYGGHVGFVTSTGVYYNENQTLSFINERR